MALRTTARARRPRGEAARPYGGRLPDERRRERRERLLDAALSLFGTEGYASATIEALCSEAGVATRHFYDEFPTREALLRAAYDGIIETVERAVVTALAGASGGPRDRTRTSLEAFLHAYLDDPRRARIGCVEAVGVSAEMERHRRSVIHRFAAVIQMESERQAREGRVPAWDFRFASLALAGATNELLIEYLMMRPRPPLDDLRDELLGLYVAVLEGAPVARAYVGALRTAADRSSARNTDGEAVP